MAVQTEYVYVTDAKGNQVRTQNRSASLGGLRRSSSVTTDAQGNRTERSSRGYQTAGTPRGVPRFLGNRSVLFLSWGVAMALVSWDEWSNNGILPRPARLWDTTWVYAGLALVSGIDALVPIANALGIGYTIVLAYQGFTGGGGFAGPLIKAGQEAGSA